MNSTPHLSKGHQCFPAGNGNLNLKRDVFFQTGAPSSYPENKIWSNNFWALPKLDAFVGYQYWLNKFGNNNTKVPGSLANAVFFGLRYHL